LTLENSSREKISVRLIGLLVSVSLIALKGEDVSFERTKVESFYLAGIEARTSNELEMQGKGKIGETIARVRKDGVLKKLQNRVGSETYALYTQYESDRNGPYTYFLGAKVSSDKDIPTGMVLRHVPAGEYALVTGSGSPPASVAIRLWQEIWSFETSKRIDRAYKTDFEVHHGIDENNDPGSKIDLYVGLKH
jgi:predicted transcriptional regulator YdeE